MGMNIALDIAASISGQRWEWRRNRADDDSDLVTELLMARGCPADDIARHRDPTIRAWMPDPSIFADMDRAAMRIADAVERQEQVVVFGDYDVDGATSAALLIRLLRDLGLQADAYIPDRLMEGYGPSGAALTRLAQDGAQLIVTVDCGAQAFAALEAARTAGVDVIVVDHHQCASSLPPALAVVNPNRLDESADGAAHGHLAAVGVAFLLGAALIRTLRGRGYFANRHEPALLDLLDIVALGTVADVARLTGLNRAFVAQGLKIMAGRRNIGLAALMDVARLSRAPLAHDLGFALGPRINAGGRVGKSDLGVRLLTTGDPLEAADIARELDQLNAERRAIEAAVQQDAETQLGVSPDAAVHVLSGEGWHPGVIGIVAGRIKEKTGSPAIVIALDADGTGKGSGRSIPGIDLGAAVLAAKDHGLLIAGGGHAMAAGLTVARDNVRPLTGFLNDRLGTAIAQARADRALKLDIMVNPRGVNPDLVTTLDNGGPYGTGWPAPRIVTGPVRILRADIVGNGHVRALLSGDDGASIKGVAFRQADSDLGQALLGASKDRRLWVAGRAKIDDWGGRRAAEMHIDDAAWADR